MLVGNSGGARRDWLHCLTFEVKSPQVLSHLLLKFNGRYFSLAAPTCHQKHPYLVYSFLETTLTYYNRLGCKSHPWLPISCQTISGNTTTPVPQCNYSNVKSFTKTMFLSKILNSKIQNLPAICCNNFQMQTISIVDFLLLSSTAIPGLKHTDRDPSHHHCSYGKLASKTYFVYGMLIASKAHKHFLA